jgi:hypothetical protein
MLKLNPKERKAVYFQAAISISEWDWHCDCICWSIMNNLPSKYRAKYMSHPKGITEFLVELFPELRFFEQEQAYWFGHPSDGVKRDRVNRVNALLFCIELTKEATI